MRRCIIACLLWAACSLGCTHRQLARSTVMTAGTVMDIQYRIVLTNLAMFSQHPETLPSQIEIDDGVIQISDEFGLGTSGGFTSLSRFGIDRFGPSGRHSTSEQWGADATLDPERITELQSLYRAALGLAPLSPPNAVLFMRQIRKEAAKSENSDDSDDSDDSSDSRKVPIEVLLRDVPPPGWYQIGHKHEVPDNACYVGCFGDRYAWVTPEGIPGLARFTVTILTVVKLDTGVPSQRGLMVSR